MRRTQLYLEDDLWKALRIRAREQHTTISDLVRQAVRDRYCSVSVSRKEAMQSFVGMWNDRRDIANSSTYLRHIRKGSRLERIAS